MSPLALSRCEDLSDNAYQDDILILAGDISDDQAVLRATFQLMAAKFGHVFFVPGNHDLWVRRKEREVLDSLGARFQHRASTPERPLCVVAMGCSGQQHACMWLLWQVCRHHATVWQPCKCSFSPFSLLALQNCSRPWECLVAKNVFPTLCYSTSAQSRRTMVGPCHDAPQASWR